MSLMSVYNLSENQEFTRILNSNNVSNIIEDNKYINATNYSTKSNEIYRIVRYDKKMLANDHISKYGLFRSVIINSLNNVVCFSPPKSFPTDKFMEIYPLPNTKSIIAQEFVEGTMINVFFDPSVGLTGCWQIATRSTVGANVSFFKGATKTFSDMFMDACTENQLFINTLNPNFCYSFVLQHPCNRIVVPFTKPQLYLVEVFQIIQNGDGVKVYTQNISEVKQYGFWNLTTIRFPDMYEFETYSELIEKFSSPNTPYHILGIVIKNSITNERCKIRNPIYEEVRHLRGNQPKMQYQYLCLRKAGKIPEFLKFFPETKNELSGYRDHLHMFTNALHQNYISCYVKKEKPLAQFPDQYRTHMYNIHQHYLTNLREKKESITNTFVINFVNNLPPSLLMYCLNHNLRKQNVDTVKTSIV